MNSQTRHRGPSQTDRPRAARTGSILARFAYTGLDGAPRVVSRSGFLWNGREQLDIWTAARLRPRSRPSPPTRASAITIDTPGIPATVLLVRGTVTLDDQSTACPTATSRPRPSCRGRADQPEQWEAGCASAATTRWCVVAVTPSWAKLLDFETTIPQAVQDSSTRSRPVVPTQPEAAGRSEPAVRPAPCSTRTGRPTRWRGDAGRPGAGPASRGRTSGRATRAPSPPRPRR